MRQGSGCSARAEASAVSRFAAWFFVEHRAGRRQSVVDKPLVLLRVPGNRTSASSQSSGHHREPRELAHVASRRVSCASPVGVCFYCFNDYMHKFKRPKTTASLQILISALCRRCDRYHSHLPWKLIHKRQSSVAALPGHCFTHCVRAESRGLMFSAQPEWEPSRRIWQTLRGRAVGSQPPCSLNFGRCLLDVWKQICYHP